ncbi:MAG: hypothetical protein JRE40_00150 [Deltaproteobacteria bacterium]|nr:hypothetical protein [Deltaproteobacteria bacterium]
MKYYVENPNINNEEDKRFPLIEVEVKQLLYPVVTKTGEIGIGMSATVDCLGTRRRGHAVCIPGDKFSFFEGGKRALKRALDTSKYRKKSRTSIWTGFIQLMEGVE